MLKLILTEQEYALLISLVQRSTLAVPEVEIFLSLARKLQQPEKVGKNGEEKE